MTWLGMSNLSEKLVGCDGETVGRSGSGLKLPGGVPRRGDSPAVNEAIRLLRFWPNGPKEWMIGSFSSSWSEKSCDELRLSCGIASKAWSCCDSACVD